MKKPSFWDELEAWEKDAYMTFDKAFNEIANELYEEIKADFYVLPGFKKKRHSEIIYLDELGHEFLHNKDICTKCGKSLMELAYSIEAKCNCSGYNTGPVCECGSEAVGSPRHSDWCPKYKEILK